MRVPVWWKLWGSLIKKLLALFASFASLAGLLFCFLPPSNELPWWAVTLLTIAVVFLGILVIREVNENRERRVFKRDDERGIRDYMHKWIQHGGRVAIWSRDLSWAQNDETRALLAEKAGRNELIVCMPETNALAEELAAAGAEVCAYGAGNLEAPDSRFTIVSFGRDGSRVAVGRTQGDLHAVDEFCSGQHPAFHLANDLMNLVRSISKAKG
ncbi:hypothetical protein ABI59_16870 [Acidobacteria bacterium Mor1]|nr:hypothetical protein ABI59_16870 [Acidobacteria bacterium Mor1]